MLTALASRPSVVLSAEWLRAGLPDFELICKAYPPLARCSHVSLLVEGEDGADELLKALNPGERWITVHPPGHDKGVPILITEHPDGTATVIGGAGGSMNHLKMRGVKPQADYRQELAQKAQERRAGKQAQTAADKESGLYEVKKAQRAQLRQAMQAQRDDFVQTVAAAAGWDPKDLQFDEDSHANLSPEALDKARKEHGKALLTRAKQTVELNRRALVEDHEALVASGLGELPLAASSPDVLSVADLDPLPETAPGLGFATEYSRRAAEKGLTAEALEAATLAITGPKEPNLEKKALADKVQHELEGFRKLNPDSGPPNAKVLEDAKKAATLVKALKKLRLAEKAARESAEKIDFGDGTESKAAILEVSDAAVEEAARKEIEDDIRTAGTRTFLQETAKMGGETGLGGHVVAGAFNALNAFAVTVAGDGLIDRSVADVLGVDGAAAILARRVSQSLSPEELEQTRKAMGEYHVAHFQRLEGEALDKAQEFQDAAAALEVPDASNGFEFAEAQAINQRRRDALGEAKRILGQAMGEMRGNAALVNALNGPPAQSLDISLGGLSAESAVVQLSAIGLEEADYHLAPAGDNLVATVGASGLDRLARPVDKEGLAIIKRNLDIAAGKYDEDDWLPQGFARRPDLSMQAPPGVAPRLAKPFQPGPDLAQSLRSYIGGRVADGDALSDILADVQSGDFYGKAGDNEAYRQALDAVAPLKGEGGKMKPIESLEGAFQGYADEFVKDQYGDAVSPLHRQSFAVDQKAVDSLHQALAAQPEGVAAFKPIGDLTPVERMGLRSWWYKNVAKEDPKAAEARAKLEAHVSAEPTKVTTDMFGEQSVSPEWTAWNSQKNELAATVSAGSLNWAKYSEAMGSPTAAIEAVQDLVRSGVAKAFAEHFNSGGNASPLKVGKTTIRGSLDHLDAVDPEARADRQAKQKALVDALRERIDGKYASGSVQDKLEAAKEEKAAFEQAQMGFFSTEDLPGSAGSGEEFPTAPPQLGADERFTLGHVAEQKLAGMMSIMGDNYTPGKPTKIWQPSMNGKYAAQQRAIKHTVANKRTVLAYGAGSGKTPIMLGTFSHLHETGKAKRGAFIVPSVVQGQIGGEALRFLEPGKFNWHAQPGASREERLAAYKDPSHHFVVMTHQSFRDDMVHLGAQHAGVDEATMHQQVNAMSAPQRKAWARSIMDKEGFDFPYMAVDEAHDTLNRAGKDNSGMANVIDAFTDNAEYFQSASGDPVKNDASELHDLMAKMDRGRYGDRGAFMRKYGGDTVGARQALKREMARHVISNTIGSGNKTAHSIVSVDLSPGQQQAMKELGSMVARARVARLSGKVDVEAAMHLSPSMFEGVPKEQHEKVARAVQQSIGIIKNSAEKTIINAHPDGAKLDAVVAQVKARPGKQGVVFANRRESVEQITKRLTAEGYRVVTVTGSDSAADKDKKRLIFNPESGPAGADIMVASDAAAVGMNLQAGQYLLQNDTPDTAKTHGQRNARIDRIGQKKDVELIDLKANHPSEDRARDRLAKKYGLREFMLDPMEGLDDTGLASFLHQSSLQSQIDQGALF